MIKTFLKHQKKPAMKTKKLIHVCGSVIKNESIVSISANILENTTVAEANLPYFDYYGSIPERAKPNSLFLFTNQYYSLDETLRFMQKIKMCESNKVNAASSVLYFQAKSYPAIRIKNFPDYNMVKNLQHCLEEQGIHYLKKINLPENALVKTNKCFVLEKVRDEIYFDHLQEKTGYIFLPKLISYEIFTTLIQTIQNNSDFQLFDAAWGGIIIKQKVTDIVRIYSEKLNVALLENIKEKIERLI